MTKCVEICRYIITERIGQGSFGIVHKCLEAIRASRNLDSSGNVGTDEVYRIIAVKSIRRDNKPPNEMNIETDSAVDNGCGIACAVLREISLLRKLHHRNIVSLVEVCFGRTHIHIMLEYYPSTLHEVIGGALASGATTFGPRTLYNYSRQLFAAIEHCHENRCFHRDIKPSNILIDSTMTRIVLTDFGMARYLITKLHAELDF